MLKDYEEETHYLYKDSHFTGIDLKIDNSSTYWNSLKNKKIPRLEWSLQ